MVYDDRVTRLRQGAGSHQACMGGRSNATLDSQAVVFIEFKVFKGERFPISQRATAAT